MTRYGSTCPCILTSIPCHSKAHSGRRLGASLSLSTVLIVSLLSGGLINLLIRVNYTSRMATWFFKVCHFLFIYYIVNFFILCFDDSVGLFRRGISTSYQCHCNLFLS